MSSTPILQAITLAALSIITQNTWAVNKCTLPNGKVVFQDLPCENSSKSERLKVNPATTDSTSTTPYSSDPTLQEIRRRTDAQSKAYRELLDSLIANAKRTCEMTELPKLPEIGWTESKFLECTRYGIVGTNSIVSKVKVNETNTAAGVSKQFVFRDPDAYVYTTNGIVTAVQQSRQ